MIGVALITCTLLIYVFFSWPYCLILLKIKDNSMVTILQALPEICL